MNDFDKAGRRAVKDDPRGHVRWIFPRLPTTWRWQRWLDAQSAPRPGEPDRRCDTIAELIDSEGGGPPFATVIELFTQDDPDALDRAMEYKSRYRRELRHGPHDQDRYPMAVALLFFTTAPAQTKLEEVLPGGDSTLLSAPKVLSLAGESALVTLEKIEENQLSLGIAVWLSLMEGGNTAEVVKRWRELILARESDEQRQRSMAGLVVVLAELTNCQDVWIKGLEGFAVNESTLMRAAREEGHLKGVDVGIKKGQATGQRIALVRLLRSKCASELPGELQTRIDNQQDIDVLSRWFDLALAETTLEGFINKMDP